MRHYNRRKEFFMTQREFFTAITESDVAQELKDYATAQKEKLDARNASRSSKPSKKSIENEPIKAAILERLTDEYQPASEIAAALVISTQKASSLLSQLNAEGKIEVENIKVPKKGKCKGYKKIAAEVGA